MPTRIGYPNEHLAGDSDAETTNPIFATAVGLVMQGLEEPQALLKIEKPQWKQTVSTEPQSVKNEQPVEAQAIHADPVAQPTKGKGILDSLTQRIKDFLDNAE